MKTINNRSGFTLVELMVVMVILGVLALIAIPVFGTNYEGEFNKAVKELTQNIIRARTMSLSRKENHVIRIADDKQYYLQAVDLKDPEKYMIPRIRDITLPSAAKITGIKQCADYDGASCPSIANTGELRFMPTSEMLSCVGALGSCPRSLKSMTIYLQAVKPNGDLAPITKKIIVFSITGHIKVF